MNFLLFFFHNVDEGCRTEMQKITRARGKEERDRSDDDDDAGEAWGGGYGG